MTTWESAVVRIQTDRSTPLEEQEASKKIGGDSESDEHRTRLQHGSDACQMTTGIIVSLIRLETGQSDWSVVIVQSPSRLIDDTYRFLKVRIGPLDYHQNQNIIKNIPYEYVPDQVGFRFRLPLPTDYTSLFSPPNQQL